MTDQPSERPQVPVDAIITKDGAIAPVSHTAGGLRYLHPYPAADGTQRICHLAAYKYSDSVVIFLSSASVELTDDPCLSLGTFEEGSDSQTMTVHEITEGSLTVDPDTGHIRLTTVDKDGLPRQFDTAEGYWAQVPLGPRCSITASQSSVTLTLLDGQAGG